MTSRHLLLFGLLLGAALPAQTYAFVKRQLRAPVIEAARELLEGGVDPLAAAWFGGETTDAAGAVLRGEG